MREEAPPAVKLTLVVTLEEPGVPSCDLLMFGCFVVLWGFYPLPFSFSVGPFVELLLPKRRRGVAGWTELRSCPDPGSIVGLLGVYAVNHGSLAAASVDEMVR